MIFDEDINIKLDTDKGLFFGRNLTYDEKVYLESHGYESGMFVPIGKPRQEECWIKKNGVESLKHTFLVQNIKQHLRKCTKDIKINITKDADIEFRDQRGQLVGIEIETGTQYKKNRKGFDTKFSQLRKRYKRLYIVLTTKKYKRHYKRALHMHIYLRQEIPTLFRRIYG
ncbi:MAG: hypothetical protein AABX51_02305 [Nanoarchaeota archaeon]